MNEQTCVQCHKPITYTVSIDNTNIAYPVLADRKIYDNDARLISVCHNPECPNYGMLQISNEQMPTK